MSKERAFALPLYAGHLLMGRMITEKLSATGNAYPWGVPAGAIRGGERIIRAVKREMCQETRKDIPTRRFEFVGSVEDLRDGYIFYIFRVPLSAREYRENVPPHRNEFIEFRWFPLGELPWDDMLPEHALWLPQMLYTRQQLRIVIRR